MDRSVQAGVRRLLRRPRAGARQLARSVCRRAPVGVLRGGERGLLPRSAGDEAALSRRLRAAAPLLPPGPGGAIIRRMQPEQARTIYDQLTAGRTQFLRPDEPCPRAAPPFPTLPPSDAALAAEAPRMQRDKLGLEKA